MEIKVLGTGCLKCQKLYQNILDVILEEDIITSIAKIEDIEKIMEYNVLSLPALVINNKVVFAGVVPNKEQIKEYLLKDYN